MFELLKHMRDAQDQRSSSKTLMSGTNTLYNNRFKISSKLVDLFLIDKFLNLILLYNTPHLECII